MTINLPDDLERFIRAEIRSGHFASEDDAISEAVRLLQLQLNQGAGMPTSGRAPDAKVDPLLGALRDAADEMDEIVAVVDIASRDLFTSAVPIQRPSG